MSNSASLFSSLTPEAEVGPNHWHGETVGQIPWDVYLGDAHDVLLTLPENHFSCSVTSPPYYWLRDYGVDNQIGQEETIDLYVNSISTVMDEVRRVLRPDGVLFLNLGDTYYSGKGKSHGKDRKSKKRRFGLRAVDKSGGMGAAKLLPKSIIGIPWRVAIEMSQRGWVLRSSIIWHRKNSLPETVKDRPRRSYEYVFMFAQKRRYYFNREAFISKPEIEEDMWTIAARPKPTSGVDTAPYPDELVQRCLDLGCPPDGTVLDPFAGAGTTLRVALQSGRPATGIDLNPSFCEYIVNELKKF